MICGIILPALFGKTHLVRSLRVGFSHAEVLARLRMRVELRILDPEAGLAFSLKLWDGEKWSFRWI